MLVPLPSGGVDTPAATRAAAAPAHGIHMPSPSFYPLVAALGILPILGYAAVFHSFRWCFALLAVGAIDPRVRHLRVGDRTRHRAGGGALMATIEQAPAAPRPPPGRPTAATPARPPTTGTTNIKLAIWLFLASDCLFFGAFISAYLLYRGRPQTRPDAPARCTASPSRPCRRSCCS